MKKLTLVLIILLVSSAVQVLAFASGSSTASSTASSIASSTAPFEMKTIDTHRKIGLAVIKKEKNKSKVEFESVNLKPGKYVLYLSRYCQPIKSKKVRGRQQKNQLGTAILDFTTRSGSLWSEQWLTANDDLPIHNPDQAFVFVLVRKDKAGTQIVGKSLCGRLTAPDVVSDTVTENQTALDSGN